MLNKKKVLNGFKALLLPLFVYLLFFVVSGGAFGSWATVKNNAVNMVQPVLMGWGLCFIFQSGMWDMSPASVIYFSAIMAGNLASRLDLGLVGIVAVCLLCALVLYLFTALLCSMFNVSSMIITLGLLLFYETLTTFVFKGKGTYVMGDMAMLGRSPYCFVLLGVAFVLVMLIWTRTKTAQHIRAVGANEEIAASIGINVMQTRFKAFLLGGFFIGLSAIAFLSNLGNVNAVLNMTSMSVNFEAMMGMFIGVSLMRYVSLPIGIVLGSFTMKMLSTGLMALGLSATLRDVFTGVFLLVFLTISINQNKLFEYREQRRRAKLARTGQH